MNELECWFAGGVALSGRGSCEAAFLQEHQIQRARRREWPENCRRRPEKGPLSEYFLPGIDLARNRSRRK